MLFELLWYGACQYSCRIATVQDIYTTPRQGLPFRASAPQQYKCHTA
uniref:Uncharacterized protein n=1 Tax=Anguilla anguilla TaxID=7936 RepID=A0A0E9WEW8_ANGAN